MIIKKFINGKLVEIKNNENTIDKNNINSNNKNTSSLNPKNISINTSVNSINTTSNVNSSSFLSTKKSGGCGCRGGI